MKHLLLAAASAGLMALAATAARVDGLPGYGSTKDAPYAPRSWTGFYVAGGFGYGTWTADTTTVSPVTGACVLCVEQTQGGKGGFGAVGMGYDVQLSDRFVAGVFVDASIDRIDGSIQDQGPFFAGAVREDRSFALGARAGVLINPTVLPYVTAGYSRAHFTGADMVNTFSGLSSGFSTPAVSRGGWFVGTGVEFVLRPGWLWRTEYRYADYGAVTLTDTNAIGTAANSIRFRPVEQTIRGELVYKFNVGAM